MIYMATNSVNFKNYIGQTSHTLAQRRGRHESNARCGKRSRFYSALRKYGPAGFTWRVLITDSGNRKTTDAYERFLIVLFSAQDIHWGYNLTSGGEGMSSPSDETRRRMSESHKGIYPSDETKQKIKTARRGQRPTLGYHTSEETKQKLSAALSGRPGRITFLGRKHSTEARAKMTKPKSSEHRAKLSAAAYNRYRRS
jgi:group I intron endonuclease